MRANIDPISLSVSNDSSIPLEVMWRYADRFDSYPSGLVRRAKSGGFAAPYRLAVRDRPPIRTGWGGPSSVEVCRAPRSIGDFSHRELPVMSSDTRMVSSAARTCGPAEADSPRWRAGGTLATSLHRPCPR